MTIADPPSLLPLLPEVRARILAYAPKVLTEAQWLPLRAGVVDLVARCEPKTAVEARVLCSNCCAVLSAFVAEMSEPTSATKAQLSEFHRLIALRQAYALRRISVEGGQRMSCPAIAGTVGCARKDLTIEAAIIRKLPIIINPPDDDVAPKCCTQTTVTMGPDAQRKLWQQEYWGSPAWILSNNRRTFVEGVFGNVKNASTENLCRGFFRITGLARVTLLVGIALVAHNARQPGNWHDRTGNGGANHPLLQPDSEAIQVYLTPIQYQAYEAWLATQPPPDDRTEAA
jgi:hypothetical protein